MCLWSYISTYSINSVSVFTCTGITMTTVADLVNILESTTSPKKLLMVCGKFVAPPYMANPVFKISGSYHAPVSMNTEHRECLKLPLLFDHNDSKWQVSSVPLMTMATSADLVHILESTHSPKKLLTIQPSFIAPIYGAEAVIKVSGTFHDSVGLFYLKSYLN